MSKKKIVVLTGAGISAESGLKTFRDAGGLWEGYNVMEVATPEAWDANPELVLRFYNERREAAANAVPNAGHKALAELEQYFDVCIVTQNVDNLHERGGSTNIIHLHGELSKVRSEVYSELIYEYGAKPIYLGDNCEKGFQLRPHIVWFGEEVPMMQIARSEAKTADIFMVVGTSMVVYPAAGLIDYAPRHVPKYIIDPNKPTLPNTNRYANISFVTEKASIGVPQIAQTLISQWQSDDWANEVYFHHSTAYIEFDKKRNIILARWVGNALGKEHQIIFEKMLALAIQKNCYTFILDQTNKTGFTPQEDLGWLQQSFLPQIIQSAGNNLQIAVIPSLQPLAQMSNEHLAKILTDASLKAQYFEKQETALAHLTQMAE